MRSREGFAIRELALAALEKSTRMLEVALELVKQGNHEEAARLRNEARTQRTNSMSLLAEANNLERDLKGVPARRSEKSANRAPQVHVYRERPVTHSELR